MTPTSVVGIGGITRLFSGLKRSFAAVTFFASDRLALYREIAALNRAGLPSASILEQLLMVKSHEGRRPNSTEAIILTDVLRRRRNGAELAAALRPWIPTDDAMVLEAAQNSDDFATKIDEYCEVLEGKAEMKRALMGLAYPLILFVVLFVMLKVFASQIMPTMATILPVEQWTGFAGGLAMLGEFSENWIDWIAAGIVLALLGIMVALPRWAAKGRSIADRLPIFSIYRMYTGVGFLLSLASLTNGGLDETSALERLQRNANPYVRYRIGLIRRRMFNGFDLGPAIAGTGTGWPDPEMNLSIKIFAQTSDLPTHLTKLSKDWLASSLRKINREVAGLKTAMIGLVFIMVLLIIGGMFDIQDQMSNQIFL